MRPVALQLRSYCTPAPGNVLISRKLTAPRRRRSSNSNDELFDQSNIMPASALREITLALAPPDRPNVELPVRQLADLDRLYDLLTQPLPPLKTQAEKRQARYLREEAESADAFFALPGFKRNDPESHAYRIRCLGEQGKLKQAHAAFDEMEQMGVKPDMNCTHALADACDKCGSVEGVEGVIKLTKRLKMPLTAPLFTALIGAHRNSRMHALEQVPHVVDSLLERAGESGIVQDAPLHTAGITWLASVGLHEEAWAAYHHSRSLGIRADAVTYTALIVSCAAGDKLELAKNLMVEMQSQQVAPTLATFNAFINVCSSRAASLAELPEYKHRQLRRLAVDIDVRSPVRAAQATLLQLMGEGHAPDLYTFRALLRVAAGAADLELAQSLFTRLLDTDVQADRSHFHHLLRACVRTGRYRPVETHEAAMRVALSVPPSMVQLGVEPSATTINHVIETLAECDSPGRALVLLDSMFDQYGVQPTPRSFRMLLQYAERNRAPQLAADLLQRMEARGLTPDEEQRQLPERLGMPHERLEYPELPTEVWSPIYGFVRPELAPATRKAWTRVEPPMPGGVDDFIEEEASRPESDDAREPLTPDQRTRRLAQIVSRRAAAAKLVSSTAEEGGVGQDDDEEEEMDDDEYWGGRRAPAAKARAANAAKAAKATHVPEDEQLLPMPAGMVSASAADGEEEEEMRMFTFGDELDLDEYYKDEYSSEYFGDRTDASGEQRVPPDAFASGLDGDESKAAMLRRQRAMQLAGGADLGSEIDAEPVKSGRGEVLHDAAEEEYYTDESREDETPSRPRLPHVGMRQSDVRAREEERLRAGRYPPHRAEGRVSYEEQNRLDSEREARDLEDLQLIEKEVAQRYRERPRERPILPKEALMAAIEEERLAALAKRQVLERMEVEEYYEDVDEYEYSEYLYEDQEAKLDDKAKR